MYFISTDFKDIRTEYKTVIMDLYRNESAANFTKKMKCVNLEYTELFDVLLKKSELSANRQKWECDVEDDFKTTLIKLLEIDGVTNEICGNWIWVSGETKPVKQTLKDAKFLFSGKKVAWYWKPKGYKKLNKKIWSLSEIRSAYGSTVLDEEDKINTMV